MRRIAALSLLVSLFISILYASDWESAAARVERSLVRVTHTGILSPGEHTCAGFVINAKKGHVLTAYHCMLDIQQETRETRVNPYIQVDGYPSYVVDSWPDDDLVLLNLTVLGKPSLDYRRKPIRKGLPVAALGFAYALPTSTLLVGVIAAPEADWGPHGYWQTIDRHSIGGMSGGPMFDEDGHIVGVTQKTDDWTYVNRPLSVVLSLTAKYWD